MNLFEKFSKGVGILIKRIRTQGLRTTGVWLLGRGIPALTRIPILKYSRVTTHLYVGSQFSQAGLAHLQKAGISAVVNMRSEKDDRIYDLSGFAYCHIPVVDDTAPAMDQLDQGCSFIEDEIRQGGIVYIHCGAGVGRAPTMAAAYLIRQGQSLEQALEMIRQVRPFIMPTPVQLLRLAEFESASRPNAEQAPLTAQPVNHQEDHCGSQNDGGTGSNIQVIT